MRRLLEDRIQRLLELHDGGEIKLRSTDERFLADCIERYGAGDRELSEKQEAWVNDLHERHVVKGER